MEFTLTCTFNTSKQNIYESWLSSEKHSEMTGGAAETSNKVGAKFTAWDGYIVGENLELEQDTRIIQSWRTSQFESSEPDSTIEIILEDLNGKTKLTLNHTNVPESGEHYINGWKAHYFEPMKLYFE